MVRLVARPMLASMFVMGGVQAIRNADALAEKAKPMIDRLTHAADSATPNDVPITRDAKTVVQANGVAQIVAGLGLATGRMPRLSATVLAASLVPTTLAGHRFWEESDPAARTSQKLDVSKNVSMLGGLLIAAVDTDGKPGVAWRAKRAMRDAKREAGHLRREAKQQARLAAKSVKS